MRMDARLGCFSASRHGAQVVRKMPSQRLGLSAVALKLRRIEQMCFGGVSLPKTKIEEPDLDFGPLPTLGTGAPIERAAPQYQDIRTGQQTRSLLMPLMRS